MYFAGFQWFLSIPEHVFWSHLVIIGCPFAFANNWTVFGGNCSFSGQSHHIHSWSCESFKRDFQCVLKLARSLSGRLLLRLLLFCLMVPPSHVFNESESCSTLHTRQRATLFCILNLRYFPPKHIASGLTASFFGGETTPSFTETQYKLKIRDNPSILALKFRYDRGGGFQRLGRECWSEPATECKLVVWQEPLDSATWL